MRPFGRVEQRESRYELRVNCPVTLSVAVDHSQFLVRDRDSEIDVDAYDTTAHTNGLASWPGGVAVFCDSHWTEATTVVISLLETQPAVELSALDRIAIAGLSCPSGELVIYAPEETGITERRVSLPAGKYGLLVCGDQFGNGDQYGDNGNDTYNLMVWPCTELPATRALKNGRPGT
jgi:hypothetical protein